MCVAMSQLMHNAIWGTVRGLAAAIAIASSAMGCLALPDVGDTSAASASACKNVDLCSTLPVADVNAALGKSFDDFEPGFDASSGPDVYSDGCIYSKFGAGDGAVSGERLYVDRSCYRHDGAAAEHLTSCPLDPEPHVYFGPCTKLTGVGDDAYFEDVPNGFSGHEARFEAVGGNFHVSLFDTNIAPGGDIQLGLGELAKMLLSR